MSNMSYCRFENTSKDLQDCYDSLTDKGMDDLSESERKCCKELISLCADIVDEFSDLTM